MTYDSTADTLDHIRMVQRFMEQAITDLRQRALVHDRSKLEDPEKPVFDEYTPKLAESTYGSPEYKEFLVGMGEGLKHHYAVNDHHPEHNPDGIRGMSLLSVLEMLADWKAATLRHRDGSLDRSIHQNASRFSYGAEFELLLRNTARELGWI